MASELTEMADNQVTRVIAACAVEEIKDFIKGDSTDVEIVLGSLALLSELIHRAYPAKK